MIKVYGQQLKGGLQCRATAKNESHRSCMYRESERVCVGGGLGMSLTTCGPAYASIRHRCFGFRVRA